MSQPLCRVCGAKATQTCGQCSISLYCGQECANTDWEHGHHARICSDADDLHTEALPLARRLFMESSLPAIDPEDRAEALELVDSLLMEHCAEEFFMENPHLIDEYLGQEELIGAGLDYGQALDEEEHLLNDLAEIRGEALAWLDDVHVRDAEDYPALYATDMIGAEFGQHAQHWQEEYELVEATLKEKWNAAKTKLKTSREKRKSKPRKQLRSPFRRGAAKAKATKLRGRLSSAKKSAGIRAGQFKKKLTKKVATARAKFKKWRSDRKIRAQGRRNVKTQEILKKQDRASPTPAPPIPAPSYSEPQLVTRGRSQTRDDEAYYRSRSAEKRQKSEERRLAREAKDAARRRAEQAQRAKEDELRLREFEAQRAETEAKRAVERAKRAEEEAVERAKRIVAQEDPRWRAEFREAQEKERRRRAELAQNPLYQPPAPSTAHPTVMVTPVPAPAPASVPVAPTRDVRTKRDTYNEKAVFAAQQQRMYEGQIAELDRQLRSDETTKARLLAALEAAPEAEKYNWQRQLTSLRDRTQKELAAKEEAQRNLAAANIRYDEIMQRREQLVPQSSASTCISWK